MKTKTQRCIQLKSSWLDMATGAPLEEEITENELRVLVAYLASEVKNPACNLLVVSAHNKLESLHNALNEK